MDEQSALEEGHAHLSEWLRNATHAWDEHGSGRISLNEQLDYYGKLSSQFPISPIRIVYAKAGVKPASAIVQDAQVVIDHKLYWMAVEDIQEAYYLCAILNSETARSRVERSQSEGLFGPRDFDKVMLDLPIPDFQSDDPLHRELAESSKAAEDVVAGLSLPTDRSFQTARGIVREEIQRRGLANRIDALVTTLLDQAGTIARP